jgi:hypothetical protein
MAGSSGSDGVEGVVGVVGVVGSSVFAQPIVIIGIIRSRTMNIKIYDLSFFNWTLLL